MTPFDITILGSNSAVPTPTRHPTSQLLNINHHYYLIDCGEGAQIQMRKFGIKFQRIEHIFISHLHGDHCGWNTRLVDGRWVPTFPNAKYIIAKDEIDHVACENTPAYQESVLPIIESGQVMAVASDFALDDHVWLEPALGHTPGHVAVHLQSRGQRAVLCGDLIHSPLQCLYPHWEYWIDYNPQQAISTRKKFLETQCEQQNLVLTAHFPSPSIGHVIARNDAFWFDFI